MLVANPKFHGLSQYRGAFNYELSGRSFHLFMDDGDEYLLHFLDGENLQWGKKGEAPVWDSYEALKGDENTYFVHIMPTSGGGKVNYSFILDTVQSLVTLITMEEGLIPDWPQLETVKPFFGAIKVPGRPLPLKRHHLSDRMAGQGIYWAYNSGMPLQHLYRTPLNVRADSGPGVDPVALLKAELAETSDPEQRAALEARILHFEERLATYPIFDEPAFHIWINDTLNLFCFVEENKMYRHPRHEGGGGLLLLQNIERLVDVGLSYSMGDYYMVTAYGQEEPRHDPLMDAETPYDWSVLKSIKWADLPVEHDEFPG